jgi:4-hydroxybenzoate polyprenyltransferase
MVSGKTKAVFIMLGPVAWIALAAGLQMLGAFLLFKVPIDFIIISTATILTFSVYLLNRFTDHEDSYNCPEQKSFFQRKTSLIILPIALLGLSFLILSLTGRLVAWHLVLVICGIFYSVSFIPVLKDKSIRFVRLKDIFFVKNILVCLLWGTTPFVLAASRGHAVLPPQSDFIVIIIASCLSALVNTTSSDIPDSLGDRRAGVMTLANRVGNQRTAIFLCSLAGIGCLAVGINFCLGNIGRLAAILFFVIVLCSGMFAAPLYVKSFKLSRSVSVSLNDSQAIFNGLTLIVISMCINNL